MDLIKVESETWCHDSRPRWQDLSTWQNRNPCPNLL